MRIFAHYIFDSRARVYIIPHSNGKKVTITVEDTLGQRLTVEVLNLEKIEDGTSEKKSKENPFTNIY